MINKDIPNLGFQIKAYTMVELVIVIIIGILSAATLPKMFKSDSYELAGFYNEVLNSIRYAQKVAVSMGCEVEVSHTSSTISLKLRANCTTGAFSVAVDDPSDTGNAYVKQAPTGITINATGFPIYFDRGGKSRNTGGAIATAQMQINTKNIEIIGETGYAREP